MSAIAVVEPSIRVDALFTCRIALRDLPANTLDPSNPIWPEPPDFTLTPAT